MTDGTSTVSPPLFEHQKETVRLMMLPENTEGFLNSGEPGTGKTLATIAALNCLATEMDIKRVLIVCPNTLRFVWKNEFEKSLKRWRIEVLDGHSRKRREILDGISSIGETKIVVIVNYESLSHILASLAIFAPQVVIGDECFPAGTEIKTPTGFTEIQKIKEGDVVCNAIGIGKVKRIFKKRSFLLSKVATEKSSFFCTPEHPILTQKGWQSACNLNQTHYIKNYAQTMSMVQEGFSAVPTELESEEKILRKILLSEVENVQGMVCQEHLRSEKGNEAQGIRVVSVENIKQESLERHGFSREGFEVYNLEVESHPSYVITQEELIVHNCHKIKNGKAQQTKALKSIKARYRWGLTGTPMTQSPLDIWSIFDWLRPGLFSNNYYAFRNRYANVYTGAGFPIIRSFKNLDELTLKVSRYSYRALKSECLDLPEKIYQSIEFDLDEGEREAYDDMAKLMIAEIGEEVIAVDTALTKLMKLQQMTSGFVLGTNGPMATGSSKLKALEELLESLEDKKVVVFCKFREEVRLVCKLLTEMKRPCLALTGDVPEGERAEAVRQFQSDAGNHVLVAITSVGGLGITLTAANHCVYLSNSFSLADRMQSEDRLHRIGQKTCVNYYELIARNSVDGYIKKIISRKAGLLARITGDDLRRMAFDK